MIHWDFAVNFFVALFALLDPIGNVPLFAASTVGASSRERAQIALYISLFAAGFLIFFYFSGLSLLAFFGLSIIVRVLGLILCAMAVQFVLAGLADATHGVILRSAASPYAH